MDRAAFLTNVEATLGRLYDRAYLATNPLGQWLSEGGAAIAPDRLHRLLVEAIEQLRPTAGSPSTSASWRRYHYLELRYLRGLSHKLTAHQLDLSIRTAHRVRTEALEAVAECLYRRRFGALDTGGAASVGAGSTARAAPAGRSSARATLDEELTRLGRQSVDAPADLTAEARAALEIVQPLVERRRVRLDVSLPPGNLPVAIGRAVLRQLVVLVVSYALDHLADDALAVSAHVDEGRVALDVVFRSEQETGAPDLHGQDSRLAAACRMAETQGATLDVVPANDLQCVRLLLPAGRLLTVLAIDDNPDLPQLFSAFLQGTRYQLRRAKTAQSALRIAEEIRPDIITLDVLMPFQDGWEIFRQLQANAATKEIPVVVCSILPEREVALAAGAADFLAKPVTRQSLLATLDRCCPG